VTVENRSRREDQRMRTRLTDLSATTRLNVLRGVGGSQTGPHLVDGDGTHHVGRMHRTLTGVDWVVDWLTCRHDSNNTLTVIPTFSGSSNPIGLLEIQCDLTGSWKSKMAAYKPDVRIYQLVDKSSIIFKWYFRFDAALLDFLLPVRLYNIFDSSIG